MSEHEPLYQLGICPNCPADSQQLFLFATDESLEPNIEHGMLVAYERCYTYSLFRCIRCGNLMFYDTTWDLPTGISIERMDDSDPAQVAKLTKAEFFELSTLLYFTKDESPKEKSI